MGARKRVRSRTIEGIAWINLEDYPPGTPLPEPSAPDFSELSPAMRVLARRAWHRGRARRIERYERARNWYYEHARDKPGE